MGLPPWHGLFRLTWACAYAPCWKDEPASVARPFVLLVVFGRHHHWIKLRLIIFWEMISTVYTLIRHTPAVALVYDSMYWWRWLSTKVGPFVALFVAFWFNSNPEAVGSSCTCLYSGDVWSTLYTSYIDVLVHFVTCVNLTGFAEYCIWPKQNEQADTLVRLVGTCL